MKILHYSIIIILLIGISFFINENAYGCFSTCPPIPTPPHYASPTITVHTNLENYSTGDNIVITGHVFNQTKDTPLIIKIFDPMRQSQFDKNVLVSSNGNYTWTLSTVDFWSFDASGNYTILSQYGQVFATTHFYLNSTLTQYLYSQSPLWQFRNGMAAQDVHCHAGLSLILKKENLAPTCVRTLTATNLILSGWAIQHLPKPFIEKFAITGLRQNYTIGRPINVTVTYSGYYWYTEPDAKILDINGTQIWSNCINCYVRSEAIRSPSFDTFTYIVRDYGSNKLPVINKTGTYTMIVSLDNKTASAEFTIVKPMLPHTSLEACDTPYPQSDTGIAVLYMPVNSIGKICVQYHNLNNTPTSIGMRIFEANDLTQNASNVTAWTYDSTLEANANKTVVYFIKTGTIAGFYGASLNCGGIPLAVGYDANSTITASDFPWVGHVFNCGIITYESHMEGTAGIGVRYIPYSYAGLK
ncbi:MAG TPA: hypothetical protein VFV16_01705 [Candidatus Nitrosotalea sp.]|nr:hypothetical protein [Candidatus Nitrosotalea sp.]